MRTNIFITRCTLSAFLLTVFFLISQSASAGCSWNSDRQYRDSLRRQIFSTGAAEVSCYLSYPIGNSVVDSAFATNASELSTLHRFLRYAMQDTLVCIRGVSVTGHCSVDGPTEVNDLLSVQRATRLLAHLDAYYHISEQYDVQVSGKGADWTKLRHLLEASSHDWRHEALRIIDGTVDDELKKLQLSQLAGGRTNEVLYTLYPLLRRVEVKIHYDLQCMQSKMPSVGFMQSSRYRQRVLRLRQMNHVSRPALRPVAALKTNLLFDVAMMPNIELEIPLGRRWSLAGEYMFPWWLIDNDRYCLQILSGTIEGRYWWGNRYNRPPLTGHFTGIYAGVGKYDLQWQESGYRDETFVTAGLSYGYGLKLARHWNMEFSIGMGVLSTHYGHYHTRDNFRTLVWQNDGHRLWVGPTKAKVSLVWLLGKTR